MVTGVAFSRDGKRLATAGDDGIIQMYALDLRELLSVARSRVTRPFIPGVRALFPVGNLSALASDRERWIIRPCVCLGYEVESSRRDRHEALGSSTLKDSGSHASLRRLPTEER